jgi:hypothetical protein
MKNFKFYLLLLIFQSCNHEFDQLREIKKLSKIDFPKQSEVIFYNDDYEGLLVFQLEIDFSCENAFLYKNHFQKLNKNKYLNTIFSRDELAIQQMNDHFKCKIHINDNLMLLRNENYILVVDPSRNVLWGYLYY